MRAVLDPNVIISEVLSPTGSPAAGFPYTPGGPPIPAQPGIGGIMDAMPRNFHLERFPGKHVAIDMATDEVVLTADSPQELHEEIQLRGLRNVATMRAPCEGEPLFVGPF